MGNSMGTQKNNNQGLNTIGTFLVETLNVELLNDGRHTFETGNKSSAIVQTTLVARAKWRFLD